MCIRTVEWAATQAVTGWAKPVLICLAHHRNGKTGRCDPSATRIGNWIGCDERTVRRALETLAASGLIVRSQRPGKTDAFLLNPGQSDRGDPGQPDTPDSVTVLSECPDTPDSLSYEQERTGIKKDPSLRSGVTHAGKRSQQADRDQTAAVGLGNRSGGDPFGSPPQPPADGSPPAARDPGTGRAGHRRARTVAPADHQAPQLALLEAPFEINPISNGALTEIDVAREHWNAMAERTGLPAAQRLTEPRQRALTARISDLGGLEGWDDMLAKLDGSSDWFRHHFRPGLDWCLKPANLTKIMEGNYDGQPSGSLGSPSARSVRPAGGDDAFLEQCYRIARRA